ncbi:MAG: hypothetical protein A2W80_06920 [Candidatus Riflebacteria bacterium GWC2_50_8]|nr:MAG: hypothetical protein A2W80_06920 [Candidatus Riflebacteria bacterium GWC2_50_8]
MLSIVCIIFVDTCFAAPPNSRVTAVSQPAKRLSDRESAMINSLLRQAQQAHNRGDAAGVKSLLFQTRLVDPGLPAPAWLKKAATPTPQNPQQSSGQQLMEKIRNNPGNMNLIRLEEYVRNNPEDHEAREFLITEAIEAGAIRVLDRVEASAENENHALLYSLLKWLFVILLAAALIWPAYALIRDLKAS